MGLTEPEKAKLEQGVLAQNDPWTVICGGRWSDISEQDQVPRIVGRKKSQQAGALL